MSKTLRVTVITGPHRNQQFCLRGEGECVVGRGQDCLIQLAGTHRDDLISRHHCRFFLDGQRLRIEDLGSLNGTFVDGKKVDFVELSLPDQSEEAECDCAQEACAGNLVTVGGTTLKIDVIDCPPEKSDFTVSWETGESVKKNCPAKCDK